MTQIVNLNLTSEAAVDQSIIDFNTEAANESHPYRMVKVVLKRFGMPQVSPAIAAAWGGYTEEQRLDVWNRFISTSRPVTEPPS